MNHYVDIEIQPDPEIASNVLLNMLFAKLHRRLVEIQNDTQIGVSFPQINEERLHLGNLMRLHGSGQSLGKLFAANWLQAMADHVKQTEITGIPIATSHRYWRRVQVKSNPDRLRRRLMKRHSIDATEAIKRIPDSVAKSVELPWLKLRSVSTGETFKLFLKAHPVQSNAKVGTFNAYGFSVDATLPWF
jgi:CRISPR-associated endonuclease Csy4